MAKEHIDTPQDALSALADGQLRGEAFALAVERVAQQPEAQATWHAYHVVGDVLRSNDLAFCADDQGFLARFQNRLALEPVLASTVNTTNLIAIAAYESSAKALFDAQDKSDDVAANAPSFRWKMVAGVASLLAVVAVGWNVAGGLGAVPTGQQLAQVTPAAPVLQTVAQANTVSAAPQIMLRDARLDALMAAHKQFGGTSALQMPAGFISNATYEIPAR
ncbi:sigma-E factor negative regulatory protein [Rhodoferax sp.]|uniref:sigma-E factor negative regulatory protein n=1 Tax=Rhodoferax sp. TaxID=50421 RepID=UPI0025F7DD92|nr:sigma-E factor negative regulatory protein [Rhodoferax sp.]